MDGWNFGKVLEVFHQLIGLSKNIVVNTFPGQGYAEMMQGLVWQ